MSQTRQEDCPAKCGGKITIGSIQGLFGGEPMELRSTCRVCEAAKLKAAEEARMSELAASLRLSAGCAAPYVHPNFSAKVERCVDWAKEGNTGIRWVVGDVMSGKTTLAKAWVHAMIDAGHPATYVDVMDILRLPAREVAGAMPPRGIPFLALDGLLQTGVDLQPWEAARITEILSGRGDLATIVTSPYAISNKGPVVGMLGEALAKRAYIMTKSGTTL